MAAPSLLLSRHSKCEPTRYVRLSFVSDADHLFLSLLYHRLRLCESCIHAVPVFSHHRARLHGVVLTSRPLRLLHCASADATYTGVVVYYLAVLNLLPFLDPLPQVYVVWVLLTAADLHVFIATQVSWCPHWASLSFPLLVQGSMG
ncbi:hypothetical protein B0H21DRAFT_525629 [Amylocystis lapponica]|nr:hypothetical protein B0H21DRAFT_525629 [Amylocystis lapponica]